MIEPAQIWWSAADIADARLPVRARLKLIEPPKEMKAKRSREQAWADYDRLTATGKSKAEIHLKAVQHVFECEEAGATFQRVRFWVSQMQITALLLKKLRIG